MTAARDWRRWALLAGIGACAGAAAIVFGMLLNRTELLVSREEAAVVLHIERLDRELQRFLVESEVASGGTSGAAPDQRAEPELRLDILLSRLDLVASVHGKRLEEAAAAPGTLARLRAAAAAMERATRDGNLADAERRRRVRAAAAEADDLVGALRTDANVVQTMHDEAVAAGIRELQIAAAAAFSAVALLLGMLALDRGRQARRIAQAHDEMARALDQLRATKSQLVEMEKMAALSGMVAGIAHEVNTPVGTALAAASELKDSVAQVVRQLDAQSLTQDDLTEFLDRAVRLAALVGSSAARTGRLIESFKQVSLDQAGEERRVLELKTYVEETLASLASSWQRPGLSAAVAVPPGIVLDTFPGLLVHVLSRLLVNAAQHAFPDSRAGNVTIAAREVELAAVDPRAPAPGAPNLQAVELTVADDGVGVPEENRRRVFEPFFTTRRAAGQVGLGLHVVFNIVTQRLGGTVAIASGAGGRGTAIVLTFPRVSPLADEAAPAGA
ncbi:MAG: HAMP domain-containing histidine kinase [Alphaproteobacteria bacterium]|nr:HAMP domain-containing histidine kinase [Alphaproteobacteria bacterium]